MAKEGTFEVFSHLPAGPLYSDLPNPSMGKNIHGSKINPIVKSTPLPKLLASRLSPHKENEVYKGDKQKDDPPPGFSNHLKPTK